MYMYMYLRISVPTVQMLLKTNAPVHVKPERQITLISYNYNDITQFYGNKTHKLQDKKTNWYFLHKKKNLLFDPELNYYT